MINIQKIKLNDLHIDEDCNFKDVDQTYYNKLKKQIEKNKELYPLLCYEYNDNIYIIDGITRFKIYQELKWETCHINLLKDISPLKAQLIKLQTFEGMDIDILKTAKLMQRLSEKLTVKQISSQINFNERQVKKYVDIYNWDWSYFDVTGIHNSILDNNEELSVIKGTLF